MEPGDEYKLENITTEIIELLYDYEKVGGIDVSNFISFKKYKIMNLNGINEKVINKLYIKIYNIYNLYTNLYINMHNLYINT